MKDVIKYKVQLFDNSIDDWYTLDSGIKSKKEAKSIVHDCEMFDKEDGLKSKYRIVKQTIKTEVVK